MKQPQNYFYYASAGTCYPCKPECEICNSTTVAYPNNCVVCQAPFFNPPACDQRCGKTFSG